MTIAKITEAARQLRIPTPTAEILQEIQGLEGPTLARAIDAAGRGDARAIFFLKGVFLACHESTRLRLRQCRLAAPALGTLVAIGKAEGPEFALRLKEWAERGTPDGDDARYLRLTMARHMEAGAAPAASPDLRPLAPTVNLASYRPGRGVPSAAPAHVQSERAPDPQPDTQLGPTHQAESSERAEPTQKYLSQHIYGGKAAACFSADQTRSEVHTVRLEAAEASATRQYDWQRKIAVQLSQRELPLVLAVFMGWLPRFEGKGHGENNSKWFTLENQGNKLYLSVNAKGQSPRGVPIMPGDGYAVTTLLMRQMLRNDPFLSPEILLSLVKKEAALASSEPRAPMARAA